MNRTVAIIVLLAHLGFIGCAGSKFKNKGVAKSSEELMVVEYKDLLTEEIRSFTITSTVTLKPYYSSLPYVKGFRYKLNLDKKPRINESDLKVYIPPLTISDRFSEDSTLFALIEIGMATREFGPAIELSDSIGAVRNVLDVYSTKLIEKEVVEGKDIFYHFDIYYRGDTVKDASYIFNYKVGFVEIKNFDSKGLCDSHLVIKKINGTPYVKSWGSYILFINPTLISFEKY